MKIGQQYNPYRMFHGSFIPNWLMRMRGLSPGAKLCFARLAQYAGDNGKCYPKQDTLSEELAVSRFQIAKYIKELVKNNLIESIRKGLGRPNQYKFIWSSVCESALLDVADSTTQDVADSTTPMKRISSRESVKHSVARKRDDRKSTPSFGISQSNNGQNQFDINCTNRLIKILQAKRKIMRRVNTNSWISQFRKLRVDDEVEKRRIKKVLLWYAEQDFNDRYLPKAYSSESFRKKFLQIEDKMNQSQDPKRKKDYKPGDPEDDFKTTTTRWVTKDGKKRSRVEIDES